MGFYYQINIKEGNKLKMLFNIRYHYFEYQVMLSRLSNVLTRFQSYMNKILAKKLNIFVIVYLNDIIIYIKGRS